MNKQKLIELLESFCNKEEFRENLRRPFLVDDFVIATDGIRCIAVKNGGLALPFEKNKSESLENTARNVLNVKNGDGIGFNFSDLKEKIKPIIVPERIFDTCSKCDGEGECDHCGQDCEKCGGVGTVGESKLTGRDIPHELCYYLLSNGVSIAHKVISDLIRACEALEITNVTYFPGEPNKQQNFILNSKDSVNVKIILMPIFAREDTKEFEVSIDFPTKKKRNESK